MTQHFLRPGKH
uniref:Uncharacterized protein n=1 Tax=Arundo donax TaxID=35708 RepID=A0A0A9E940_ARUDO